MQETKSNLGKMIFLAIGLIIGISFLGPLNSLISTHTDFYYGEDTLNVTLALIDANNVNESYVYQLDGGTDTGGPGNFYDFHMSNSADAMLEDGVDFQLDEDSGSLTLENTTKILNGNPLHAMYKYKDDGYLDSSLSRALLGMLIVIFALAIVALIISKLTGLFTTK